MSFLFDSFEGWKKHCETKNVSLVQAVVEYEIKQKGRTEEKIWETLGHAWEV
ncbi:MAG TPA: serine dehydratase, partial [Cytophagales bacterium]|nr:serine dehydratase [Cytophagales bacterium]